MQTAADRIRGNLGSMMFELCLRDAEIERLKEENEQLRKSAEKLNETKDECSKL